MSTAHSVSAPCNDRELAHGVGRSRSAGPRATRSAWPTPSRPRSETQCSGTPCVDDCATPWRQTQRASRPAMSWFASSPPPISAPGQRFLERLLTPWATSAGPHRRGQGDDAPHRVVRFAGDPDDRGPSAAARSPRISAAVRRSPVPMPIPSHLLGVRRRRTGIARRPAWILAHGSPDRPVSPRRRIRVRPGAGSAAGPFRVGQASPRPGNTIDLFDRSTP